MVDASLSLVLERRWFDEDWVDAVLTIARRSSEDPKPLLDVLLRGPDPFHEMLMLAARCAREVQDAASSEGRVPLAVDGLVDELAVTAVSASTRDRRRAAEALGTLENPGAVPPLRRLLHDEDHEVQAAAAQALASVDDGAALDALVDALGRFFVGETVARSLAGAGPSAVDRVLERLSEERATPGWLGGAAGVLAASGDSRAAEALASLAAHLDPMVRRAAARAMWKAGDEFAPLLVGLLGDVDEDVAAAAAGALGQIGAGHAHDALAEAARRHPSGKVRAAALTAFGHLPEPERMGLLFELLEDPDESVAMGAAFALGRTGDGRAHGVLRERAASQGRRHVGAAAARAFSSGLGVEALVGLLDDDELVLRCSAIDALGGVGDEAAVDALVDLVERGDPAHSADDATEPVHLTVFSLADSSASHLVADGTLRGHVALLACAAEALGRLRHPRSLRPLLNVLPHPHPAVRAYAARGLGSLGDPAAFEPLLARLADEVAGVRACAARALGAVGDRRALDGLVGLLADANSDVQASAVEALGALGDPRAIEPLVGVLRHDQSSVMPWRPRVVNKGWAKAATALVDIARGREGAGAAGAILAHWPVVQAPAEANVVLYEVLAQLAPQLYGHAGDAGWARTCAALAAPTAFALALGLLASPEPAHRARGEQEASTVLASPAGRALGEVYFDHLGQAERIKELAKAANEALGRQDPEAALSAYQGILELDPDNRYAWSGLGHAYEGLRRYDDAVESYRRAVGRFPEDAMLWMSLGLAYVHQGRPDQAIEPYLRAIELDPDEPFFHERLGDAYLWVHRYDDAVAAFERVLDMGGPRNTRLFPGLCRALLGAGRPHDAVAAGRRAADVFPNDAETLLALADALAESDDEEGAIEVLRRVVALEPGNLFAANRLATLSFARGDLAEIGAVLEHALAAADTSNRRDDALVGVTLTNLAAALEQQGKMAAARDTRERGLAAVEGVYGEQHPLFARCAGELGGLLFRLGEKGLARSHFERALAIDEAVHGGDHPAIVPDLENLAAVLVALGERQEAVAALQRALTIVEATEGRESARAAEISEKLSALS